MLGLSLTFLLSLTFSSFIFNLVKSNKSIYYSMLLVYFPWYLPVVTSLILPFDYFGVKGDAFPIVFLSLFFINLILFSGALVYQKKVKKYVHQNNRLSSSRRFDFLLFYYPLAYLACVFEMIKKISRGFIFSIESIASNRGLSIVTYDPSIYSYFSILCSGFLYYLLFFSIERNEKKLKIRFYFLLPFLFYSLISFISGVKSTIFVGILIIIFRLIYVYSHKIKKILVTILIICLFFWGISIWQNMIRTLSVKTTDDYLALSSVGLDKNHPLYELFKNSPTFVQINLSTLYTYFGVQYDMMYVSMILAAPGDVPFGSSSFQILRRTYLVLTGESRTDDYTSISAFHSLVNRYYGVFPRVWGSIFWPFYMEGGFFYVLFIVITLMITHYYLMLKHIKINSEYTMFNLFIFYLILTLGFMGSPFTLTFTLIIAAIMRPFANSLAKNLITPFRRTADVR